VCSQANIPFKDVTMGLIVPKISSSTLPVAVGALGALVMPYNIYFQVAAASSLLFIPYN
jgi:Mn2+/Fe2+ NRAMP family transporter